MRFETTFFPPRTSTTSSVGISTRPILSCRLNAATRLSRLSFTFFSKPDYVWMMYHCIPIDLWSPLTAKLLEDVLHPALHSQIHYPQENAEKRHRGDDHPGGRDHVFAARPGDLLHLHANVVEKFACVVHGSGDFVPKLGTHSPLRFAVLPFDRLRGHESSFNPVGHAFLPVLFPFA